MDQRERGDRAFYAQRNAGWDVVGDEDREALQALSAVIAAARDAAGQNRSDSSPSPIEVALQLSEVASRLFTATANEERDVRQVITTLRTALAVCWDMYSYTETGRVTVHEHMQRLRMQIEEFENDLSDLQSKRTENG